MKNKIKKIILILLTLALILSGLGMDFQSVADSSSISNTAALEHSASNAYYKPNNSMVETQLLRDSSAKKTTYTYTDKEGKWGNANRSYDTEFNLAINNFFAVSIDVFDESGISAVKRDYKNEYDVYLSNPFVPIVYFYQTNSIESDYKNSKFYGKIKHYVEDGYIKLSYARSENYAFKEIINSNDLVASNPQNKNLTISVDDLSFVNNIVSNEVMLSRIENQQNLDKMFIEEGIYKLEISYRSRWKCESENIGNYYENMDPIVIYFHKTLPLEKNLLLPTEYTLQELFYGLSLDGETVDQLFLNAYDPYKANTSNAENYKLGISFYSFEERIIDNIKYQYCICNPKNAAIKIEYKNDNKTTPTIIYYATDFLSSQCQGDSFFVKQSDNSIYEYWLPQASSISLFNNMSWKNKGEYTISITYDAVLVNMQNYQVISTETKSCKDIYKFSIE